MGLKIGDKAPDFKLLGSNGKREELSDYKGKKVVLYFYPKDMTPGCTTEACDFRDYHDEFAGVNAVVLGVSTDPLARHEKFIAKYGLPFVLLADEDHVCAERYGVWQLKKLAGREYMGVVRTTFLIDEEGTIQAIWDKVKVKDHVAAVLESSK